VPSRRLIVACAAGALVAGLGAVPARAQTSNADRQAQLGQQINEAGASEADALRALQQIRDRKAPIDARVAQLDADLAAIEARLGPLTAESDRLAEQIRQAQTEVAAAQKDFREARARFDDQAALLYRSARRGASYEVVAASQPADLIQGTAYVDTINRKQQQVVHKIATLRDEVDARRQALTDQKGQVAAATAEVQALRDEAAAKRAEVEPARAQAAAEAKAEEAQLAAIRSQKGRYEAELAALKAASESIGNVIRGNGSTPGVAGACSVHPVNAPVTSTFGWRVHPITGERRLHEGMDLGAASGTPIKACRSGRVTFAGWQGGYGNVVIIDHGGGMSTVYGHQSSVAVSAGQQVNAGQVIGSVGSTGMSTGPHLHFEVRINGTPVDPAPYF